jgi:hypothetical protein
MRLFIKLVTTKNDIASLYNHLRSCKDCLSREEEEGLSLTEHPTKQ